MSESGSPCRRAAWSGQLAERQPHFGFAVPGQAVTLREPALQVVPAEELGAMVGQPGDPVEHHGDAYFDPRHRAARQ